MWCNVGFANNFEYICSFKTYFKTSDIDDWNNKILSGKSRSIYDPKYSDVYLDIEEIIFLEISEKFKIFYLTGYTKLWCLQFKEIETRMNMFQTYYISI